MLECNCVPEAWPFCRLALLNKLNLNAVWELLFFVSKAGFFRNIEEKSYWRLSGVFSVNFEQISHIVLVFPLLTLGK